MSWAWLRQRLLPLGVVLLLFTAGVGPVLADVVSGIDAETRDIRQQVAKIRDTYLSKADLTGRHHAEERLIEGENQYRLKDYQRAAIVLLDVTESYPDHAVFPEALFYLSESLFMARDFFGARVWFEKFVDAGNVGGYSKFRTRALGRLLEIAIHLNDPEAARRFFGQLDQAPDAGLWYIKGKYLYFQGDMDGALAEFRKVDVPGALFLKACYFAGVIRTRQSQLEEALKEFDRGVQAPARLLPEEKKIVDLLNLGRGRIYYERNQLLAAAAAYRLIDKYSPWYDVAMYESAAVEIQMGNSIAAERILEVLTLAVPDSPYLPRARLLRGNLLMRAGRYDEAQLVFQETISAYAPVESRLDEVLIQAKDMDVFFESLMARSEDALDVAGELPMEVIHYAADEPVLKRAFVVTGDMGMARGNLKDSERLIGLLEAVIDGAEGVNAIPELREARRRCQGHRNRLSVLLHALMKHSEGQFISQAPELGATASQRMAFDAKVKALPITAEAFQKREKQSVEQHRKLRQELSRQVLMLDNISASIVALDRFVADPAYVKGVPPESLQGLKDELARHRAGLDVMRTEVENLRRDVERAALATASGGTEERKDAELARTLNEIAKRESVIVTAKGGGEGKNLAKVLNSLSVAFKEIELVLTAIDAKTQRQVTRIRQQVAQEKEKVREYEQELALLSDEAREVVGGVTVENFSGVRQRFHDLLLKADVGIIDIAWVRKDRHKNRTIELTKRRMEEIRQLDEEFASARDSANVPAAE